MFDTYNIEGFWTRILNFRPDPDPKPWLEVWPRLVPEYPGEEGGHGVHAGGLLHQPLQHRHPLCRLHSHIILGGVYVLELFL